MSDIAPRIAEIYGGPLDTFVAARDALARELRQAGDRDAAAEVKALRKPRALAWGLDAAALAAPDALAALVAAVDAAGRAQADGGDVRSALADLRAAEADVVAAAVDATAAHGQPVDATAAGAALRAVVSDPDALADLQAVRLVDTPATGGLGAAFAGAPAATRPSPPPPRRKPAAEPRRKPEPEEPAVDKAALTAARRAVDSAERALRTATNAARRAADSADEVEKRAAAARRRSDEAAEAEREAEATLAKAREDLAALEPQSSRR